MVFHCFSLNRANPDLQVMGARLFLSCRGDEPHIQYDAQVSEMFPQLAETGESISRATG